MAQYDNSYSRLVAWAKIALPLIALGILSTLFLLSRGVDPETALPFSETELDEMLQQERLRDPAFAGVTEDGAAVAIGAATAQPDPSAPGRAMAEGLAARVDQPDGGWLRVTADQGVIDQGQARARLEGGVALETSTGFDIRTDAVTTRFDQTRVDTDGAVTADGPPGRVEAGQMSLRLDEQGAYVLDFTGGVRLVYTPPAADEGEP